MIHFTAYPMETGHSKKITHREGFKAPGKDPQLPRSFQLSNQCMHMVNCTFTLEMIKI